MHARMIGASVILACVAARAAAQTPPTPGPTPGPTTPTAAPAPTPAPGPAPEPAPGPEPAPAPAADRALLDALMTLFSPWAGPAERQAALADPALRDPRAAAPLVFLLGDRDARVRALSARALGDFAGERRVEEALIAVLRRRYEPPEVRAAAADALARQRGPAAADALYGVYHDEHEPLAVRDAARKALETAFPEVLATRGRAEVVDRGGRGLLTAGGAVLGSFALASVGALGENDAGTTIGALGGIVVGGGAAYLLTRKGEIPSAQSMWILSGGGWGTALGMMTAAAIELDASDRLVLSSGLIGEIAGTAAAIATRRAWRFTENDVYLLNIGGVLGMDLAYGLRLLGDGGDERTSYRFAVGGGLLGLAVGGGLARSLEFSFGDRLLTIDGAYEGLFTGLVLPYAIGTETSRGRSAAHYLGVGLGFAAGAALAQYTELAPNDIALAWLISSYGKLAGYGIPLLAAKDGTAQARGTLLGGAAALAAAYVAVPHIQIRDGDAALVGLGTGLGLWHGLAFGTAKDSLDDDQVAGLTLLGASIGGLGSLALSQALRLTNTEVAAVGGGAFWGTWFTIWAGALIQDPATTDTDLRWAAVAGDAGLAAGALLVSQVDARRIGVANLGGLAGAGLASLAAALATRDNDKVITANLIGSAAGLAAGAALAATIDFAPAGRSPRTTRRWPLPTVAPLVMAATSAPAFGLSVSFTER